MGAHVSLNLFTTHVCRKAKVAAPAWRLSGSRISRAFWKLRAALIWYTQPPEAPCTRSDV